MKKRRHSRQFISSELSSQSL